MGTAFQNATSIVKFHELPIWFPNSVLGHFHGCSSLQEISFPVKQTSVPNSVFDGCSSLKKVYLNEGLTSTVYGSFAGSANNITIFFPMTFTTFANNWTGTTNRNYNVVMASETPIANDPGSFIIAAYVPDGSVDAYKEAWPSRAAKIYPVSQYDG